MSDLKTEKVLFMNRGDSSSFITQSREFQSLKILAMDLRTRFNAGWIKTPNFSVSVCDRPLRAPIDSKIFEREHQKCEFMTGNVSSHVQQSFFVRSKSDQECNGFNFGPGELMNADLKGVRELARKGQYSAKKVMGWFDGLENTSVANQSTILYFVFHRSDNKTLIPHGWIHTKANGELLNDIVFNKSPNSYEVMRDAQRVFTLQRSNEQTIFTVKDGQVVFEDFDAIAGESTNQYERMR